MESLLSADNNLHNELNATIRNLDHRIDVMQRKLRSPQLPDEQRAALEEELEQLKANLALFVQQINLFQKRKRARWSRIVFIACLVFGCFFLYSTYVLVYGPNRLRQ